jgi:C-terminal processing protease CtpA/Prc
MSVRNTQIFELVAALVAVMGIPGASRAQPQQIQADQVLRSDLAPVWRYQGDTAGLTVTDALVGSWLEQEGPAPGATLTPVDPVLRAQLDIPPGEGLLVQALRNHSPSARAGLQQNDILLTLEGKPLATVEDLTKQLKAAGEAPVLSFIRQGKVCALKVRTIYRVTLGPVEAQKTEYYLGVSLKPVDDALRAQLQLPQSQGVAVTSVAEGSPAAKAKIKRLDILLTLGGKPIDSNDALVQQAQAIKDKSTEMEILRAGKKVTIEITPAARQTPVNTAQETRLFWYTEQPKLSVSNVLADSIDSGNVLAHREGEATLRHRIEELEKEVKSLRESLDKAVKKLKASEDEKR